MAALPLTSVLGKTTSRHATACQLCAVGTGPRLPHSKSGPRILEPVHHASFEGTFLFSRFHNATSLRHHVTPHAVQLAESQPDVRIDQELLSAPTEEGQKYRLQQLSGKVIVVICAGYPKKQFIYDKAKSLGVRVVLIDVPNHWGKDAVGTVFDAFYPVAFEKDQPAQAFDHVLDTLNKIREDFGSVDGICSFSDLAQPLVAHVTEYLRYPGNSQDSVHMARNKELMREALEAAGVPTPAHMIILNPDHLDEAAKKIGFPAVLKPISGSESIGVVRVDNEEELRTNYQCIQNTLGHTVYQDGVLRVVETDEDAAVSANAAMEFHVDIMMEQYLDGPEVDVDMVLHEGRVVYANVVDNWPCFEPWFQETGTNVPSTLPEEQQRELVDMATQCVKAMGLTHGVQHVELKYTNRGARLIEVNCRMGGKCVRDENLLSTGIDLVEEQLMAAIGLPNAPPTAAQPLNYIAEYSINAPRSGILQDLKHIEKWQDHPDVIYCRPIAQPGTKMVCAQQGFPNWVCEVMVRKPNIHDAIAFVKSIQQDICNSVNIKPQSA